MTSSTAENTSRTGAADAKGYERRKRIASVASLVVGLVYLVVMAVGLGPRINELVQGLVGPNRWLRLAVLAFLYAAGLEVATVAFDFWSGFVLEHRYELSNQSLPRWVWQHVKGYLVGGPIGLALVVGLYAVVWYAGAWWWAWAAAGWLAVTLVLGRLVPVVILPLFYRVTRLDDPTLIDRLRRLAAGTGLGVEGVYRLHLSAETTKANAALAGLGRTRRVLLGDTLLDRFTPEEIEVVFAHEVGHHVYGHVPKTIGASLVLAVASFRLADWVLRNAGGALGYSAFDDPAALPLLLLVFMGFGLVLAPAQNALSRYFERQCDRYALARTGLRDAYRSAFLKLAEMNKADLDPSRWAVWLFHDHPPIRERLALADAVAPDRATRYQAPT